MPANLKICSGKLFFFDKLVQEFSALSLFIPLSEVGLVILSSLTQLP